MLPKAEKAKRRNFSASEKRRILAAVDLASEHGEIGRILRREDLYHSQLAKWRQQTAEAIELGLREKAVALLGELLLSGRGKHYAQDYRIVCAS